MELTPRRYLPKNNKRYNKSYRIKHFPFKKSFVSETTWNDMCLIFFTKFRRHICNRNKLGNTLFNVWCELDGSKSTTQRSYFLVVIFNYHGNVKRSLRWIFLFVNGFCPLSFFIVWNNFHFFTISSFFAIFFFIHVDCKMKTILLKIVLLCSLKPFTRYKYICDYFT